MTYERHRFSSCHRHPTIPVTGFCASCLRERLAGIDSSAGDDDYPARESHPPPELRRTKSCSGSRQAPSAGTAISEPRRRSCDFRARSTLWDLFNLDDEKKVLNRKFEVESGRLGFEIREEKEEHGNGNEAITVCGDGFVCNGVVTDGRDEDEEETKTMKEFMDLELRSRKNARRDFRDIAGSFCGAASVFSKKVRKWRWKRELKDHSCNGSGGFGLLMGMEVEKPRIRRLRETQSEIGEYGLGRRSCDTGLSMDAGRMSVDDSTFSFDGPRASWDGYLIGKACPRLSPVVSVVKDAYVPVNGIDSRVLVEPSPGGSAQTKDYYPDYLSWQRRRRSFDGSNSNRKPAIAEVDELKLISNAKVSPATTGLFYGAKLLITEKDLRDANLKSSNDVKSDSVLGSASKDASDVATGVNQRGFKKFHKWSKMWNKLGLVHRREDKLGEDECAAGSMVNKPLADSWQKLRRAVNVQASESVSQKLIRSYSVSCRNPCRMADLIDSLGASETKGNVHTGRQEFMLQRNRSVRYSPDKLDTGLLRFYLTPLKSYRRSKSAKSSLKDLYPISRSVL